MDNLEDIISSFVVCRIRPLKSAKWLNQGIRGTNEEVVVLIPLETWDSDNGLFCTSQIKPGQYICVEGKEAVQFPGTGGCLVLLLCLKLPKVGETVVGGRD